MRRLAERVIAVVAWAAMWTWGIVFVLAVFDAEPIEGGLLLDIWWTWVGIVTIGVLVGVACAVIYGWYDALRR